MLAPLWQSLAAAQSSIVPYASQAAQKPARASDALVDDERMRGAQMRGEAGPSLVSMTM